MNRLKNSNSVTYTGWCLPTVIYVTLATVSILIRALKGSYDATSTVLVAELIHALFWTAIMYWLCSRGYSVLSWFILLIPLILTAVFIILLETDILTRATGDSTTTTHNYVTYY